MYLRLKRFLDVIGSAIVLLASAPVLAIVAVAVRVDTPGPVIFRQTRLGLGGKPFTMFKFRSMSVGAEAGGVYESARDPRVTRIGRFIRKTSIDELPQLVNIIRGDMSLIGPRPTLVYHPWPLDQYTSQQRKRFLVRPGITGWAQVQGRKTVPWDERLTYDAEYVDRLSLFLDLRILFRTVLQVIRNADNVNIERTAPAGECGASSSVD